MGKNELYSKAAPKPPSAHSDLALDLLQGLSGSSSWTWPAYSQAQQAQCLSSVLPNRVLIQSCSALPVINYYCVARVQGKSAQVSCRQAEELMILLCWNRLNRSEHHHVGSRHSAGNPGDMGSQTDCHQQPSGMQGIDLWLQAVVLPSGGMSLLSTSCLGQLANWHLVHYRTSLICHYWFPGT